jgi:hypothetical protein
LDEVTKALEFLLGNRRVLRQGDRPWLNLVEDVDVPAEWDTRGWIEVYD